MYAEYTVLAVVFSGQEHVCLEIFKLIRKLAEACDNALRFVLILQFFRYIYKLGKFIRLRSQSFIQTKFVLKRLLLLENFLRILLVVPESFLKALFFELFYLFFKTLRVKDSLPLPLSAP